jgi:hypothetical protein
MRRKEDKKAAIPQAPGGSTQPGLDRTSVSGTRTTDADVVESKLRMPNEGDVSTDRINKRVHSLERMDSTGEKKRKQSRLSRSPSPFRSGNMPSRHDLQDDGSVRQFPHSAALNSRYRALVSVDNKLPTQLMDL